MWRLSVIKKATGQVVESFDYETEAEAKKTEQERGININFIDYSIEVKETKKGKK